MKVLFLVAVCTITLAGCTGREAAIPPSPTEGPAPAVPSSTKEFVVAYRPHGEKQMFFNETYRFSTPVELRAGPPWESDAVLETVSAGTEIVADRLRSNEQQSYYHVTTSTGSQGWLYPQELADAELEVHNTDSYRAQKKQVEEFSEYAKSMKRQPGPHVSYVNESPSTHPSKWRKENFIFAEPRQIWFIRDENVPLCSRPGELTEAELKEIIVTVLPKNATVITTKTHGETGVIFHDKWVFVQWVNANGDIALQGWVFADVVNDALVRVQK